MIDIGIFHNGASDLPIKPGKDGVMIPDGSLADMHESNVRGIRNVVHQGILADQLGFDSFWQTEHHFQPEGVEFSPAPLLSETAIAMHTKRIRLGQATNVITTHHPIRFAEEAAMLDILSGGRAEIGVGRGYQPREIETLGRNFGATIQDQERNRKQFEEAYELLIKCWTEPSFSHHGENFSVPPKYTKWFHPQTIAYFTDPKAGIALEDVLQLGGPDMYSGGNPVQATTTTLKQLSVFPQPLQKPHPQIWQPLTSDRSIKWVAEHGLNGFFMTENNSRLKRNLKIYHETAEKNGFPDLKDRGEFKYGWDSDKRRGIVPGRWIHIDKPGGIGDRERWERGMQAQWDFFGGFGFAAILAEADEPMWPMDTRITPQILEQKEVAMCGTPEHIAETLLRTREVCGYEDFAVMIWFEVGGLDHEEVEEQMYCFADEVMPILRRECGGAPDLPVCGIDFSPQPRKTPASV
jgi:alkanesulfonate monooxygenase SsuD/methylene tetrahydromethanopterin reductase-like flavin-dependent oxidoreductase (luciferase family)